MLYGLNTSVDSLGLAVSMTSVSTKVPSNMSHMYSVQAVYCCKVWKNNDRIYNWGVHDVLHS